MKLKGFNLIVKNSFRNAFRSWSLLIGLTLLIAMLSLVISLISSISNVVINNYNELASISNLRDIVADVNQQFTVKTSTNDSADGDVPRNNVEAQQYYIYRLNEQYKYTNPNLTFDWSRTDGRNFMGVKNHDNDLTIKGVAKTTSFTSEHRVDQLVISEGKGFGNSARYTVIDSTFAKKNKIKIGDIVRFQEDNLGNQFLVKSLENNMDPKIQNQIDSIEDLDDPNDTFNKLFSTYKWFQVVGFGESVDFTMPIISQSTPLPNKRTELIAYVNPSNFGLIQNDKNDLGLWAFDQNRSPLTASGNGDSEAYYSLKFNNLNGYKITDADIKKMNLDLLTMMGKENFISSSGYQPILYKNGDAAYPMSGRTAAIKSTIKIYQIIASIILIVLIIVVVFTIVLVTQKQINQTKSQIGILKALGYRKREIVWNYTSLPFLSALFGGLLGFIIAQFVQIPISIVFTTYFNLDLVKWHFDVVAFVVVVFGMWIFVTAITFLIAYLTMRENTIDLVYAAKSSNMSELGLFVKSLNRSKKIEPTMRASLLGSSLGKMTGVGFVVLLATILMTITFAMPTFLKHNEKASYEGLKYKQLVEYNDPVYNNPYTFLKTYDASIKVPEDESIFNYSKALGKLTSKPLDKDGNYDMDKITQQLLSGKIPNEYYALELKADPDGTVNPLNVMTANLKMLNSYGVILSTQYMKLISDFAEIDPFGWNILNNQWPDYLNFVNNIHDVPVIYPSNKNGEQTKEYFRILQTFYKTYTESIGLVITRDFYDPLVTKDGKTIDKKDMTYDEQINQFNKKVGVDKNYDYFGTYKNERRNGDFTFGSYLTSLQPNNNFTISDSQSQIGANHILGQLNTPTSTVDKYMTIDPDEIMKKGTDVGIAELNSYMADMLGWYSIYFSQRSGTAITQAAYSRPPYFVRQYFKKAYYAMNNADVYNFSFGVTPFNPDEEQLGVKLKVESIDKKPLSFNIYGVEDNNEFVDLRDKNNNDLIKRLYDKNNDDEVNSIVINESLATKLKLKQGDDVDLNMLYQEMNSDDNGNKKAYEVNDWVQDNPRANNLTDNYQSMADMNTLNVQVKDPNTGQYDEMSAGSLNINNKPGELYEKFMAGNVSVDEQMQKTKFKVIGVHKGYGTPMGWIQNDQAKKLMKYEQAQRYLWNTLFVTQFKNAFAYTNNVNFEVKYTKADGKGHIPGEKNTDGLMALSYDEFKKVYLDDENNPQHQQALKIWQIFNNAFPIFNFKFSMNEDIGDIQAGMPSFDKLGDYAPVTLNGGISGNKTYDGIGDSAMRTIMPISISQGILNQLTSVVLAILVLVITLVVIITFIIVLLTTSLIIKDNTRYIATLKVLGYENKEIVNMILGMYAIMIVIAFVIGFVAGWFSLVGIIHSFAMSSSFVIPVIFPWWLIFAVIAGVGGIYIITFAVGYRYVATTNATLVLSNQEI